VVFGVFLLTTGGDVSNLYGGQALGDFIVLLSGLVFSFCMVLNKSMVSRHSARISQFVTWVMFTTFVGTMPFALFLGRIAEFALSWEGWAAVAYTAVFCTFVPYLLFARAQRFVTATVASLVLKSELVMALLLSVIILNEKLSIGNGLGVAAVCVGIVLASLEPAEHRRIFGGPVGDCINHAG
jgi:drug/metabolite transporter (DMT)-like permease